LSSIRPSAGVRFPENGIFCISWFPLLDQDQKSGGLFKPLRSCDPVRHACINAGRGTLIRIRTGAGAVTAVAPEVRMGKSKPWDQMTLEEKIEMLRSELQSHQRHVAATTRALDEIRDWMKKTDQRFENLMWD
jgi:hypothetical protein